MEEVQVVSQRVVRGFSILQTEHGWSVAPQKTLIKPSRLHRNRTQAIKSYFNQPFFFRSSFNFQPPCPNAVISHRPSLLLNWWFLLAKICFPGSELCQAMCAAQKAALKHAGVFSICKRKKAIYEAPKLSKVKRYKHKYILSTTEAHMAHKPCEPQHCFVHYIERPIYISKTHRPKVKSGKRCLWGGRFLPQLSMWCLQGRESTQHPKPYKTTRDMRHLLALMQK